MGVVIFRLQVISYNWFEVVSKVWSVPQSCGSLPSYPLSTEGVISGMGYRGLGDKVVSSGAWEEQGRVPRNWDHAGNFLKEAQGICSIQDGTPGNSWGEHSCQLLLAPMEGWNCQVLTLPNTDKRGQLQRRLGSGERGMWCRTRDRKELAVDPVSHPQLMVLFLSTIKDKKEPPVSP